MKTLTKIEKWVMPANYFGTNYPDYYVVYGRHRDSDLLIESNFDYIIKALGGESKTVLIESFSHWAVGWNETIFIHQSDYKALEIADNLIGSLEDYPVLDDQAYYQRESEAKQSLWSDMNVKERMRICVKASVSIFASRNEYLTGDIDQYLIL